MKLINFFNWPRRAAENMFEVKNLAHLKVGGNVKISVKNSHSQNICWTQNVIT